MKTAVYFKLDEHIWNDFKKACSRNGFTYTDIIQELIQAWTPRPGETALNRSQLRVILSAYTLTNKYEA